MSWHSPIESTPNSAQNRALLTATKVHANVTATVDAVPEAGTNLLLIIDLHRSDH